MILDFLTNSTIIIINMNKRYFLDESFDSS